MKKANIGKIFLIYSIVLCLLFVLLSSFYYYSVQSSTAEQFNTINQTVIEQTKQTLDMKLKSIDKIAQTLIGNSDILSYIEKDYGLARINEISSIQRLLQTNVAANENIDSIYIYSKYKNEIISNGNISKENGFYDKQILESFDSMKGYYDWFGVRLITRDGKEKEVITLIRRFSVIANSNYLGACIINLDISTITNELANKTYKQAEYCILKNNGIDVSYVYNRDGKYTADNKKRDILSVLEKSNVGTVINNDKVSVYMDKSDYNNWGYYLIIPRQVLFNSIIMNVASLLLMMAIVLLLIFFLYRRINASLIRPVGGFIKSMNEYIKMIEYVPEVQLGDFEKLYKTVVDVYIKQKKQIEDSVPILKWNLLMDILNGNKTTYESVDVILHEIRTDLYAENYIVTVIEVDEQLSYFQTMITEDIYFVFESLFEKANILFNRESIKSFVTKMYGERIVIVSSFETNDANENYVRLLLCAEQLKMEINSTFEMRITIAVGGVYEHFKNIPLSYQEAEYVLKYKFIMGANSILSIEDVRPNDSNDVEQITFKISRIKELNVYSIRDYILDIFVIMREKRLSPETARQLAMQIIFNLYQVMEKVDENNIPNNMENYAGAYHVLQEKETLDEIEQNTIILISMLEQRIRKDEDELSNDPVIGDVLFFVRENYACNELSLESMAERAGMSVSNFSRRFKVVTGTTFLNYLISIRIENAKKLLRETDFEYDYITKQVGYIDVRSFIRMFKKVTGMTLGEYRSKL